MMVYVGDLFHLCCKVMAVILFYQKNLLSLSTKGIFAPTPLVSGKPIVTPNKISTDALLKICNINTQTRFIGIDNFSIIKAYTCCNVFC